MLKPPKASNTTDAFRAIEVYANALAPVVGPLLAAIAGTAAQIQDAAAQLNTETYADYSIKSDSYS